MDDIELVKEILRDKHPKADSVIFAGSRSGGRGTPRSDLDLVFLYAEVPRPYRESFLYREQIVETWIHDPETAWFFMTEFDSQQNQPILSTMLVEGIELPHSTELSQRIKGIARSFIEQGPAELAREREMQYRYGITSMLDDIRDENDRDRLLCSVNQLFTTLSDYYFRVNRVWGATGKRGIERMRAIDNGFADRFRDAFENFYKNGTRDSVLKLACGLLDSHGGPLYDWRQEAPAECRKKL
jgi:hypothetical protein